MISAIRIRYFAAARELTGRAEEQLGLEHEVSVGDLCEQLALVHPRLAAYLPRMRFAVNGEFVCMQDRVKIGDEVDLMPPVAGGSMRVFCGVQSEPLSVDAALKEVSHHGAGAVTIFTGVVRDNSEGKSVSRLDYEAHPELALKEMRRILEGLVSGKPSVGLSAHHRVGRLQVGELAIVIAASAPHRDEAFALCRAAIDRIKETVPIWKKEWCADGTPTWVALEDQ